MINTVFVSSETSVTNDLEVVRETTRSVEGGGDDTVSFIAFDSNDEDVTLDLSATSPQARILDSNDDLIQSIDVKNVRDIIGSAGDDTLTGDDQDNTLTGGDGADTLAGGVGEDTLDGGAGDDTLSYDGESAGVAVDLDGSQTAKNYVSGAEGGKRDTISNFENVIGSSGADKLTGNDDPNKLEGGGGGRHLGRRRR